MKIFLSHDSRDKPLVREFRSGLPSFLRTKTWLDEDNLKWGDPLKKRLQDAIAAEVDYLIIFLTEEALKKGWVLKELEWAAERQVRLKRSFVLPILIDPQAQLPPKWRERLYLKLSDFSHESVMALANEATMQLFQLAVESREPLEGEWVSRFRSIGVDPLKMYGFGGKGKPVHATRKAKFDASCIRALWVESGSKVEARCEGASYKIAFDIAQNLASTVTIRPSPNDPLDTTYDLKLKRVAALTELGEKEKRQESLLIVALLGAKEQKVVATSEADMVGGKAPSPSIPSPTLHIRIFDAEGKKIVDKPEAELNCGPALTELKELLNGNAFPDESELSQEKRREIIEKATSISGNTRGGLHTRLSVKLYNPAKDKESVAVTFRVCDRLGTHWYYATGDNYHTSIVKAEKREEAVLELGDPTRWRRFEYDGNWHYCADDCPDFSWISAIVIEVGGSGGGRNKRPGKGRGTVVVESFQLKGPNSK